jgi:uncharacterized membrane protein YdjX (TVP38/TMEM64 family)
VATAGHGRTRRESTAALAWRAALVGAVVVAATVLLARAVDVRTWLTAEGLRAAVGADQWYGPLGYVAALVGGMFLPVPKAVLLALGGVLFGPWRGFLYAWTGQVLGMTVLFVVARTGLRRLARRLVHEHSGVVRRLELRLEHQGIQVVAALRLFYFMGTPISIMLSTTRLRLRDFSAGTAIGVVPAVALAVLSADAVASGASALEAALIGCALVLVFGLGTLVRRRIGL